MGNSPLLCALSLEECLKQPGVEAVALATPNQVHTAQAELALNMGKHVLVEIPMGLTLADSQRLADLEDRTGLVCMVCHTQRYMSAQQEIVRRVRADELHLYRIVTQTYFFLRENTNMFGKPQFWTDELLWHQACHMADFICWLFDESDIEAWGQSGPDYPKLGIPMNLTIGMRSKQECLVSSALSFNNHGSITATYRLIGKGKLMDHENNEIPLSDGGIETQDWEFFNAIVEGRKPMTSCQTCLPTMAILDRIQTSIDGNRAYFSG